MRLILVLLVTAPPLGCRAPHTPTVEQSRQRDQELVDFNAWQARSSSNPSPLLPWSTPGDHMREQLQQQADQPVRR
jgi:hypothetical protein